MAGFFRRPAAAAPLPLPNTYWVMPERFLAGEHPAGGDEAQTAVRLAALEAAGLDYFLDLTEEHEPLHYRHLLKAGTAYRRYPIADMEIPEAVSQMQAIQAGIRDALHGGRNVYVHCRAGIGRTGTVVGCHLVEQGLDGAAALSRLNVLWRQSARSKTWRQVPQTPEQARYIQAWQPCR